MLAPSKLYEYEHLAEKCKSLAAGATDPHVKMGYEFLAQQWHAMAERERRRAARDDPQSQDNS